MRLSVREAFAQLAELEASDAECLVQAGLGHDVRVGELDVPAFLAGAVRDPKPERVVRRFVQAGEGRAFWLEALKPGRRGVAADWPVRAPAGRRGELSLEEQFAIVRKQADERTAWAEAAWTAPGQVEVTSKKLQAGRVLFTEDMWGGTDYVEVRHNKRRIRRKAEPSAQVLLTEFVERFDRTFLPVIELRF